MGIDIYAKWRGQTDEEANAQITGFDDTKGATGYLREGYHGGPYVTHFLLAEAFNENSEGARIPASVLRERLPEAIGMAITRQREIYSNDEAGVSSPEVQSFIQFVELIEKLEQEGKEPRIIASY